MVLIVFAYIIIPILTIEFAIQDAWLFSNFSVISTRGSNYNDFIIWGLIVGGYYITVFHNIRKQKQIGRVIFYILMVAMVFFVATLAIPYTPRINQFQASIHVVVAFVAAIGLMLAIYTMTYKQYKKAPHIFRKYLVVLYGISLLAVIFFLVGGMVSSLLECFFVISTVIYMQRVLFTLTY